MTTQAKPVTIATNVAPAVHKKATARAKAQGLSLREYFRRLVELDTESPLTEAKPAKAAKAPRKATTKRAPAKKKPAIGKTEAPLVPADEHHVSSPVGTIGEENATTSVEATIGGVINESIAMGAEEATDDCPCPHPKSAMKKFSWGSICGECNTRLR